jgi:Lrp/AsnC family leucine-responsive transcriptional regulator
MSKKFKLDEIDIKILEILSNNARISNLDISDKVGISPSPCLRRVKALEEKGVIKGFYTKLNEEFFDYTLTIFATISSNTSTQKEKKAFEIALEKTKEILEIYALATDTDYLLKLIVKDESHYQQVLQTIIGRIPNVAKIRTTKIAKVIKKHDNIDIN